MASSDWTGSYATAEIWEFMPNRLIYMKWALHRIGSGYDLTSSMAKLCGPMDAEKSFWIPACFPRSRWVIFLRVFILGLWLKPMRPDDDVGQFNAPLSHKGIIIWMFQFTTAHKYASQIKYIGRIPFDAIYYQTLLYQSNNQGEAATLCFNPAAIDLSYHS
jgi:hypothetical protein